MPAITVGVRHHRAEPLLILRASCSSRGHADPLTGCSLELILILTSACDGQTARLRKIEALHSAPPRHVPHFRRRSSLSNPIEYRFVVIPFVVSANGNYE